MEHVLRQRALVVAGAGVVIAAVVAAGATSALTGRDKGPVADPDAGLTDVQRAAKHDALRDGFETKIAAWFAAFKPQSVDLRSLEHSQIMAQLAAPAQTLDDAVDSADSVIVGTVAGESFDENGAVVRVNVERTLKGPASDSMLVRQTSGIWPTEDWSGVFIKDAPGDPLLFAGDHVVLFLKKVATPGADYMIQPASGHYMVDGDGRVTPVEGNPFAASIDGQPEAAFEAMVASAVEASR